MKLPTHEQQAEMAYYIWQNNGRPDGTADSDWFLAGEICIELLNQAGDE